MPINLSYQLEPWLPLLRLWYFCEKLVKAPSLSSLAGMLSKITFSMKTVLSWFSARGVLSHPEKETALWGTFLASPGRAGDALHVGQYISS